MRSKTAKGIAFLVAIAMVLALIPASAFAEGGEGTGSDGVSLDEQAILDSVQCSLAGVTASVSDSNKEVKIKVPYGFTGKVSNADCTFRYKSAYSGATLESTFSLEKGENAAVIFEYGESGGPTNTSTYNFIVEEKAFVDPVFNGSSPLEVTGAVGTDGITIPASLFDARYQENDGGPITQIEITSVPASDGVELKLNGNSLSGPINYSDIKSGKLKAVASAAVSGVSFRFDVYHQKDGTPTKVATNVILKVTASLNTSLGDVTGNVDQNKNYTMSTAMSSIQSKAATTLTNIRFTTLPSSTYGTLYTDSGKGTSVKANDAFSWTNGEKVVFYSGTTAGTATINYEAWDALNTIYTGSIKITVAAATADTTVKFSVDQDDTLAFTRTGFNTASNNATGSSLNYIVFNSLPSSTQGVLYYNYKSSSNKGTAVSSSSGNSSSYRYTYSSSDTKAIANVTFVPKSNYKGTFSINYTGYSNNDKTFTGKISIEVKATGGDIDTITQSVNKGSKATLSASTLNSKFKSATGETLSYVKFDSASATNWTLYYEYKSSSDTGSKVSTSTKYYRSPSSSQKDLGKVSFVPKSSYTGTLYVDYYAYDSDDEEYTGRIKFTVGGDSGEDTDADIDLISYTIAQDKTQALSATTMNTKFKSAADDEALFYATFEQPDSGGTLYYDYVSSSNMGTKVSESTKYYRTASGSRKLINNITFVPKSGYNGTVYIDYVGYDEDDEEYTGQIKIKVGSGTSSEDDLATLTYSIKASETLTALANSINTAFKKVDGDNLDYATFTLPSSAMGTLYTSYNTSTKTGSAAGSSTKYYRTGTPSLNSVVFVPNTSYTGTFDLKYRAYDEDGDYYDGIIRITVTAGSVSKYFTDVTSSYSWAATEIDSLYSRGIVKGTTSTAYSPAANIKRGDFMLMLYRAFNLKSNVSTSDFKDVAKNSYYYDAIKVGKALGIAQGNASGKFEPEANLTRQDAMALVYRTMEVAGKNLTKGTSADMTQFSDRSMVSSYAYTAVATLVKANVIKGTTDTGGKYKLNPKAQMTRAEMAVVLYRVLGL